MRVAARVAVVTGAAGGIGAALATELVEAGAAVIVTDIDRDRLATVAERLGPRAAPVAADASDSDGLSRIVSVAEERFGAVDLFFANAGVMGEPGLGDSDEAWQRALEVNVLAHVRAARLLLPGWLERGAGHFVATASAAGLLTQIGSAPYAVSKHGTVAFAEWLSVTYGARGIGVSCLCPMGVNTNMLTSSLESSDETHRLAAEAVAASGPVLEPAEVAQLTIDAVEHGRFLVLPHPEVLDYVRRKATDHEHWLEGMRRLQARMQSG